MTIFGQAFRLKRRHFEMIGKRRAICRLCHLRQFVGQFPDILGQFRNTDLLLIGQSYTSPIYLIPSARLKVAKAHENQIDFELASITLMELRRATLRVCSTLDNLTVFGGSRLVA